MNAGRELDKLVYVNILGGTFDPNSSYPWDTIKPYSTKIAAAWEIVENLQSRGFEVNVWGSARGGFVFQFRRDGPFSRGATMPTAAEAICIGAMGVVGVFV